MPKIYTKNTWIDEVLAGAERYDIKDNGGTVVHGNMQIGLLTSVVQAGTAADATKMNNLENGVDALDTLQAAGPGLDGWTPAVGTWTFASATTITVPSGAAALYSVGDRVKLTQTTVKYFYVVAVANTLLTITGGADYTLANAAITSPFYSHAASPLSFPNWFNWTPTLVGFSADPTGTVYRFSISGRTCTIMLRQATTGTSNATNFTVSLPVVAATITNAVWGTTAIFMTNGGAVLNTQTGGGLVSSGGSVLALYANDFGGGWSATGTKGCGALTMFYEI